MIGYDGNFGGTSPAITGVATSSSMKGDRTVYLAGVRRKGEPNINTTDQGVHLLQYYTKFVETVKGRSNVRSLIEKAKQEIHCNFSLSCVCKTTATSLEYIALGSAHVSVSDTLASCKPCHRSHLITDLTSIFHESILTNGE